MTGCSKIHFSSKRLAKDYLKAHRFNQGNTCRHVYLCPDCGSWHLTSKRAGTRSPPPKPAV